MPDQPSLVVVEWHGEPFAVLLTDPTKATRAPAGVDAAENRGVVDGPLRVLDRCRTTPALVQAVEGDVAPTKPMSCPCRRLRAGRAARSPMPPNI
jgi:hypothetical protein